MRSREKTGEIISGVLSAAAIELDGRYLHALSCLICPATNTQKRRSGTHAFDDPLTGQPNHRLLTERLERALAFGTLPGCRRALLSIDLDNFKNHNETLGRQTGDLLLIQVARRI